MELAERQKQAAGGDISDISDDEKSVSEKEDLSNKEPEAPKQYRTLTTVTTVMIE